MYCPHLENQTITIGKKKLREIKVIKTRLFKLAIYSKRLQGSYCTLKARIVVSSNFVRNII
jgi:hypothetical protein